MERVSDQAEGRLRITGAGAATKGRHMGRGPRSGMIESGKFISKNRDHLNLYASPNNQ